MTRYSSAASFHQALEERLKKQSGTHQAKRDLLAIQRLLWRLGQVSDDFVVKGGIALKLRSASARTTSDLDLRFHGDKLAHEAVLRAAVQIHADDFMTFECSWVKALEAVAGHRFRARCSIGGRAFSAFDVDFAPPEPLTGAVDLVPGADWLSFCAIPTPAFRVYPLTTQLAEKVHALTLPRRVPNTRVKDLPDLVLIGSMAESLSSSDFREALLQTFAHRRTHALPTQLPAFAESWRGPYSQLVVMNALPWTTLDEASRLAAQFVDPMLRDPRPARWSAISWAWRHIDPATDQVA